jgi:hypothetical protein
MGNSAVSLAQSGRRLDSPLTLVGCQRLLWAASMLPVGPMQRHRNSVVFGGEAEVRTRYGNDLIDPSRRFATVE